MNNRCQIGFLRRWLLKTELTPIFHAVLCSEGFDDLVTSIVAPLATGWSESCRVGLAPNEKRHLCTAHIDTGFSFHNSGHAGCHRHRLEVDYSTANQPPGATHMQQTITNVDILQDYIRGVMDRADHHANNVDQICLAIAGAIVWKKDGDLTVFARAGSMKNVLWVQINGQRYALKYDHIAKRILVQQNSTRGKVLASFTNANTPADVKRFFTTL
jgi:hypothetical protein